MTNPIKRFFQIIKAILLFPISFLQMRKTYQDIEKFRKLPQDPEEIKKLLAEMGLENEMMPFFNPMMSPQFPDQQMNKVDLSYLDENEEDENEDEEMIDD